MKDIISQLQRAFEIKKHEAKQLGVDLDDSKIHNLIKGRLFEVACAKYWTNNPDIEILEWTPDKGFQEGIHVKSNGNPDFILNVKDGDSGHTIAVECKYRSVNNKNKDTEASFTWASYSQYLRYLSFQENREIPVFIALGTEGTPSNPDHLFFGLLTDVKKSSDYHKKYNSYLGNYSSLKKFAISEKLLSDQNLFMARDLNPTA